MATLCNIIANNTTEFVKDTAIPAIKLAPVKILKPLQKFARLGGAKGKELITNMLAQNQLAQNVVKDGRELLSAMKRVGLAGALRDQDTIRATWNFLDVVPAKVIENLGNDPARWSAQRIFDASVRELELLKDSPLHRFYDKKYLDPERLDKDAIEESLAGMSINVRRVAKSYATFMRQQRAQQIKAKRVSMYWKIEGERQAGRSADDIEALIKQRDKLILDEAGLTVSSYVTHFDHHLLLDTQHSMDILLRHSAMNSVTDISEAAVRLAREIPSSQELVEQGFRGDRIDWFRQNFINALAANGGDAAAVADALPKRTAAFILQRVVNSHPTSELGAVMSRLGSAITVPYMRRRLARDVTQGIKNPFDDFANQVAQMVRVGYLEPTLAYAEVNGARLFAADPILHNEFTQFLALLRGTGKRFGLDGAFGALPGAPDVASGLTSNVTKLVYWKMLWANASSTLVNSMHLFQFGLGENGWFHGANATRILMHPDARTRAFFQSRLAELHVTESGFTGILGIGNTDDLTTHGAARLRNMAGLIDELRTATSREKANVLLRGGGNRVLAMLDLMGHSERYMRTFAAAAYMSKSATDQIIEKVGGRLVRRGTEVLIETSDGRLLDPVVELTKSYRAHRGVNPVTTSLEDAFKGLDTLDAPGGTLAATEGAEFLGVTQKADTLVEWTRVMNDSIYETNDTLFTLSQFNYSPIERAIRGLPVVGPAAGTFMNYPLHLVQRVALDMTDFMRLVWYKSTLAGKASAATEQQIRDNGMRALRRLARLAVGTQIIAGPFAFEPLLNLSLKVGNAIDPDIPESLDDPGARATLRTIEKYTSISGALGVDITNRVSPLGPVSDAVKFFAGGKYSDNSFIDMVKDFNDTVGNPLGVTRADTPEQIAAARYRFLGGTMAKFFDPNERYGNNPIGKSNPLMPLALHNIVQQGIDAYDSAHGLGIFGPEGERLEDPLPWHILLRRGFIGRTIYDREKMRSLAEVDRRRHAELSRLRLLFREAVLTDQDQQKAQRINDEYSKRVPLEGLRDGQPHPELLITASDVQKSLLRNAATHEIRQLKTLQRGAARLALRDSEVFIERAGYLRPNGVPDFDRFERTVYARDPQTWSAQELELSRHMQRFYTLIMRPTLQQGQLSQSVGF